MVVAVADEQTKLDVGAGARDDQQNHRQVLVEGFFWVGGVTPLHRSGTMKPIYHHDRSGWSFLGGGKSDVVQIFQRSEG